MSDIEKRMSKNENSYILIITLILKFVNIVSIFIGLIILVRPTSMHNII